MDYLSGVDVERLKKLWKQLDSFDPAPDFVDGLLEELFDSHSKSLKDSISLVSRSITERKQLRSRKSEGVQQRRDHAEVALRQFPMLTCYPHMEERRAHLEREMDALLRELQEEDVLAWKDLHGLYRDLFYLMYKERTLETVKRAVGEPPRMKK